MSCLISCRSKSSEISCEQCITWLLQLVHALQHVHAYGYLHLDVKPGNMLLLNNKVKLSDFGMSCQIGAENASWG